MSEIAYFKMQLLWESLVPEHEDFKVQVGSPRYQNMRTSTNLEGAGVTGEENKNFYVEGVGVYQARM